MTYSLAFLPTALKEWRKLDASLKTQFKKKLAERLEKPHAIADRLHGLQNHYKINLRVSGYRLVYEVEDDIFRVLVVAVGKRNKSVVYTRAKSRIKE